MKYTTILCMLAVGFLVGSCSSANTNLGERQTQLAEYRSELKTKKKELQALQRKISELEKALGEEDTLSSKRILVSPLVLTRQPFSHSIEARGSIRSDRNIVMSAETVGRVEQILVREGQRVARGTILIRLDASIIQRNIEEVNTSLSLAQLRFERQKNLWEQNIGTEFQYLEAKNAAETLERRLQVLIEQRAQTRIRAPFSGVVDAIACKEGELLSLGSPMLRFIDPSDAYAYAELSDSYVGKVKRGDSVQVHVLSTGLRIPSVITYAGRVLDESNRTFPVHVQLPPQGAYSPHQVVVLHIQDYHNTEALVVPSRLIQKDGEDEYVYCVVEGGEGKEVARKVSIETMLTYKGQTEVRTGLSADDRVIDQGSRNVVDGIPVQMAEKTTL